MVVRLVTHASAHTIKGADHPMGGNIHNRLGDEMWLKGGFKKWVGGRAVREVWVDR